MNSTTFEFEPAATEKHLPKTSEPSPMPGPLFLDGDPVSLHTVEADDTEFFQRGWTEPALRGPLSIERPLNGPGVEAFLDGDGDGATFLACVEEDGEYVPVGNVSLFGVVPESGCADVAYWIAPERQGEGLGRAAVSRLLHHAFAERRLHRLSAVVLDGNDGSRGLLESLGFTYEGRLREETSQAGERIDCHRYGLLAREYFDEAGAVDGDAGEVA